MTWLRLSLTGLVLSVSLSSAALAGNGNHLIYWCGTRATDEFFRMGLCLGYVKGVADHATNAGQLCIPDSVTDWQRVDVVKMYLGRHPARLSHDADRLVMDALADEFSCYTAKRR